MPSAGFKLDRPKRSVDLVTNLPKLARDPSVMAENGYRHGDSQNGVADGKETIPEYASDEKLENGADKGRSTSISYKGKEDQFGDETNSEVKYRTMAWW